MEEVDGPAADLFCQHIAGTVGDLESVNSRYSQATQIHWMASYWLMQLSVLNVSTYVRFNANNLLICSNINDFVVVFKTTILPLFQEYPNLPELSLPVQPLEVYSHGEKP
jgi:hypothetical protein